MVKAYENQITVCTCIDCGNVLSYSMEEQPESASAQYCFTCLLNFTGAVQILDLPQFPHNADVYEATHVANPDSQRWRNNCIKTFDGLREWAERNAIDELTGKRNG